VIHFHYDAVRRLESDGLTTDLARGFAAEVADPLWLLGRQWQLGEHAGEDAASPVRVSFIRHITPITLVTEREDDDPMLIPPEALVESEPEEWWTPGRRIRLGRSVATQADGLPDDPDLLLAGLPAPYQALDGSGYDGRELWRRRADEELGLDETMFEPRPPMDPDDFWNSAGFVYDADFSANGTNLKLRDHDGGDLDWYAVDANAPLSPADGTPQWTLVSRLRYPGAPTPRWWEIEDASLDIGGHAPDRDHFGTLLLIDLLASHGDDWFTFSIDTKPGTVLTLSGVKVRDSFGDEWDLEAPKDGWSLFAVSGLEPPSKEIGSSDSLLVWPTVAVPLIGPLRDEVILGLDEETGTVWAAERRIGGRDVATDPVEQPRPETADTRERKRFAYQPGPPAPRHWHPYVMDPDPGYWRYVQGRLADLSGEEVVLHPAPAVDLLYDPAWDPEVDAAQQGPPHWIEPAAVPRFGLRLERRYVLGRRADGRPVLWSERRRAPLSAPPIQSIRFDTLKETTGNGG